MELYEGLYNKAPALAQGLAAASSPMVITAALPKFAAFGAHLADERNAALAAYTSLIDFARADIELWIDRPDASIREMTDLSAKYAEYPEEVSRLRSRLEKKIGQIEHAYL